MRTITSTVVLLALLAVSIGLPSGCDASATSTVNNDPNRGPAERIVAFSPAVAVMLNDLGLADRIVGKHDYDLVLPTTVPAVGHQEAIDYEKLLAVDPTHIVIEWGSRPLPPRLSEFAEQRNWSIVPVRLLTIDDIARTVDDLALMFGAASLNTAAPQRPDGIPENLEDLAKSVQFSDPAHRFDTDLPSASLARAWSRRGEGFESIGPVLLLGSTTPPGVLGPGSFHDQILRRIGGMPMISDESDGSPWMELDAEDIRSLDPAAIVLIAPRAADHDATPISTAQVLERLGRVGTLDIRAVRSGQVALIDGPLSLLPSTSMVGFADRLAEILTGWNGSSAQPAP